ncbi:MAG: hypothetical protein PUE85_00640 [Firmicutes bacterium]|nr:hypothetical protein [Bacillota bacterium]
MYSFARRSMRFPLIGGFVTESLAYGVYSKSLSQPCLLYELEVSSAAYEKMLKTVDAMLSDYDAYKYNFIGLPLSFFNIPYERKRHFVCSQFVAMLLENSGAAMCPNAPSLMKPADFKMLAGARLVYSGNLGGASQDVLFSDAES